MKTPWVISIVIAAHVAVAALLFQGCGTMRGTAKPPAEPAKMPEVAVEQPKPLLPPMEEVKEVRMPSTETSTYAVRKGDSLSSICKRFHLKTAEVMALNGIKDPNKIRVDQKLTLPGKVDVGAPAPVKKPAVKKAAKPAAAAAAGAEGTYEVKSGDSLSKIAAQHGVKTADLRKANNLTGDKIRVGQKLAIPGKAEAKAAEPKAATEAASPAAVTPATKPVEGALDAAPLGELKPAEAAPAALAPAASPAPSAGLREHKVDQGEDLYTVAMMYGVDVSDLKKLNGLTDTALTTGQVLKIPATE